MNYESMRNRIGEIGCIFIPYLENRRFANMRLHLVKGGEGMYSEEFKAEIKEEFRQLFREELEKAFAPKPLIRELPVLLTRQQLMELFNIRDTKASALLGRSDFPKFYEAGRVLIPSKALLQWIDDHTEWVNTNTKYFRSIG